MISPAACPHGISPVAFPGEVFKEKKLYKQFIGSSSSPLLYGVDVRVKQPQLLCVVLSGGENQVVAGQTQGPLHSGHERPM